MTLTLFKYYCIFQFYVKFWTYCILNRSNFICLWRLFRHCLQRKTWASCWDHVKYSFHLLLQRGTNLTWLLSLVVLFLFFFYGIMIIGFESFKTRSHFCDTKLSGGFLGNNKKPFHFTQCFSLLLKFFCIVFLYTLSKLLENL